jgi:N-acetyl-anhydromuramyl-L-alanine amidase AmpD
MTQIRLSQFKYVEARWFGEPFSNGNPHVIVLHTTETPEGKSGAEDNASYSSRRPDKVSAHFYVDEDSIIQAVPLDHKAFSALHNGNAIGIHVEMCGYTSQTSAQWEDSASQRTIANVVSLAIVLRSLYGANSFPLVHLTPQMVRAGQRGFCGHRDITAAFPEDHGTHTDPGKAFPWSELFTRIVKAELGTHIVQYVKLDGLEIPVLREGDADPIDKSGYQHVTRAQLLLNFIRHGTIPVDGIYGPKTVAAVQDVFKNGGKVIDLEVWTRLLALRR